MEKTKKYGWIVGGLVVLLVIFALTKKSGYRGIPEVTPTPTPSASATPSASKSAIQKSGSATSTQSYTELVKQYEGKRVQFGMNCQAVPSTISYANGTTVMFDNRSGDARTITIDGKQYQFAGYGYRILTLTSKILPHTVFLSCGSAVNVGQILLQ